MNLLGVCISQVVQDNDRVQNTGKYFARNSRNIVLLPARSFWAIGFCIPRCFAKDLLHMERS